MNPIALVQYRMLYERVIMEWVQNHETLPTIDEALRVISEIAPSGLGRPLNVDIPSDLDAAGFYNAYSRLHWNVLFLEEAIRSCRAQWNRDIIGLAAMRNRLQSQIDSLSRRIDALTRRDADVIFTRYDTFDNVLYTNPSSTVLVDVVRGVVTLLPDMLVLVDGFETRRTDNGLILLRQDAVDISGVHLKVAGNGVVSIRLRTPDGLVDVYRSAFAGSDYVEFGVHSVLEVHVNFDGLGSVETASPFIRRYQPDGSFISSVWSIPAGQGGELSRYVRVVIEGETPPGTSVVPHIRTVYGSSRSDWKPASKPLPLPLVREEYVLDSWEFLEDERIYRSTDRIPLSSLQVFVGSGQWRLDGTPLDSEQAERIRRGKSLTVDESYLSSRIVSGYLTAVAASVRYHSDGKVAAIAPTSGANPDACLYRAGGESPVYVLCADRLQPDMLYRLEGFLNVTEPVFIGMRMELQGNFVASMIVNGVQVMSHGVGSSSMSDKKQFSTVQLRPGSNRIALLFAVPEGVSESYLLWDVGSGDVSAFSNAFRECSSHSLRTDAFSTNSCYAVFNDGTGLRLEMALPMIEVPHGRTTLQPPKVRVVSSNFMEVEGIEVRIDLSTEDISRTPVIRSYRLEVLR